MYITYITNCLLHPVTHIANTLPKWDTCTCTCIHTHKKPTITPPSLSYFLFPCCFSMLSLSLEKLLTCGAIPSYNSKFHLSTFKKDAVYPTWDRMSSHCVLPSLKREPHPPTPDWSFRSKSLNFQIDIANNDDFHPNMIHKWWMVPLFFFKKRVKSRWAPHR